jgi:hypothetical protein
MDLGGKNVEFHFIKILHLSDNFVKIQHLT